uniref:Uncharacterized protein n=1 Tax=Rhizophora mucronata TaxID=61149 RepID=A0A2P2IK43_RHIMU
MGHCFRPSGNRGSLC